MDFNVYRISRIGFIRKSFLVYDGDSLIYRVNKYGFFRKGFNVTDYHNNLKFQIKYSPGFIGMKFQIIDASENQMAFIDKVFSLTKNNLIVESVIGQLSIEGNFKRSEYTMRQNNLEIAKVSRNKFDSKNYIVLGVRSDVRQDIIIGITLSIILKIQRQNARRSG